MVKGNAILSAEYAKTIAETCGKDEDYCNKAYYFTMMDAVGLSGVARKVVNINDADLADTKRIAEVTGDYVHMVTGDEDHSALPEYVARETLIREAGEKYDLAYANVLAKMIDSKDREDDSLYFETESGNSCGGYREHITKGIEDGAKEKIIYFDSLNGTVSPNIAGAPSIILFDSFDRRVHNDAKIIEEYHYIEYGEVWFDGNFVSTSAKKMALTELRTKENATATGIEKRKEPYEIRAARFEDHVRILMTGPTHVAVVVIALPDKTQPVYIGITGEQCEISNIMIEIASQETEEEDIARIVSEVSYIDCLESDLKNVQIDRTRSAASAGVEIRKRTKLIFHAMSLPSANLIWHCPYAVIYSSGDGKVNGTDYQEYALIKMNGENEESKYAHNRFRMRRNDDFLGWEAWKAANKEGLDYELTLEKKGERIVFKAVNLGIEIENTTEMEDWPDKIYVALTGDRVALTDIRVR